MALVDGLRDEVRFILDSGAFSDHFAYLKGLAKGAAPARTKLSEYISFCEQHGHKFWSYVTYDKIGDAVRSLERYKTIRAARLHPMPVVHPGTSNSELSEYISDVGEGGIIGVGGVAGRISGAAGIGSGRLVGYRLAQKISQLSGGTVRVHALGFMNWHLTFRFPIHSADNVTYANGSRYGWISTFDRRYGIRGMRVPEMVQNSSKKAYRHIFAGLGKNYGITPSMFNDTDNLQSPASIPSYTTIAAHLDYFLYAARERDFLHFFGVSYLMSSNQIFACLFSYTGGGCYSYTLYKKYYHTLNSMAKVLGGEGEYAMFIRVNLLRIYAEWERDTNQ